MSIKDYKNLFRQRLIQTGPEDMGVEPVGAEGSFIYGRDGRRYLDMVAGVSALPLGHRPPEVEAAVRRQLARYWHVMVYGEFIQDVSVELAEELASLLPGNLSKMYPVNSGTEAVEAALKLAKRYTGRPKIVAAVHSYHGNTQGSMSVMGYEPRKRPFVPLIPGVDFIRFNRKEDLDKITDRTAAVILETIQGGAGFIEPRNGYLEAVRARCDQTGSLLILDEIQTGFARTGPMFGFENYGALPDILVTGKALGGGFPIGALHTSAEMAEVLRRPPMGHITTFGGHPVVAAAALETLRQIRKRDLGAAALDKEAYIRSRFRHPLIREIRGRGLMLALMMPDKATADKLILQALEHGLILFWLLYEPRAVRLTPPLTVSYGEIDMAWEIIRKVLDSIS